MSSTVSKTPPRVMKAHVSRRTGVGQRVPAHGKTPALPFLWLPIMLVALAGCALANGWQVYLSVSQAITAKFLTQSTITLFGHTFMTIAVVFAAFMVALEIIAGAKAEQAFTVAERHGWGSSAAIRPFAIAAFLVVLAACAEFAVVILRAHAMEVRLLSDALRLTEEQRNIRRIEIEQVRSTFAVLTGITLCLTAILTGVVVRGFHRIAPAVARTLDRVWTWCGRAVRAAVAIIGTCVLVLLLCAAECIMLIVVGFIALVGFLLLAGGSLALWIVDLVDAFFEWFIRRPLRFARRAWSTLMTQRHAPVPPAASGGAPLPEEVSAVAEQHAQVSAAPTPTRDGGNGAPAPPVTVAPTSPEVPS